MLHVHVEPKVIEPVQREQRTKRADRRAQFRPLGTGAFEQRYFVFGEEDEVAVRVRMRSEIAFFCCRAEVSERFQSSLVIVLKTGAWFRAGEDAALDAGVFSGEGVLHGRSRDMRGPSRARRGNAKDFCRENIRRGSSSRSAAFRSRRTAATSRARRHCHLHATAHHSPSAKTERAAQYASDRKHRECPNTSRN
jgi:hypothetical protein